jgi:hypothetical protein
LCRNAWEQFFPKTNVLWLRFLLEQLIGKVQWFEGAEEENALACARLREYHEELAALDSASAFVKQRFLPN